jgi:hypothetical protein
LNLLIALAPLEICKESNWLTDFLHVKKHLFFFIKPGLLPSTSQKCRFHVWNSISWGVKVRLLPATGTPHKGGGCPAFVPPERSGLTEELPFRGRLF